MAMVQGAAGLRSGAMKRGQGIPDEGRLPIAHPRTAQAARHQLVLSVRDGARREQGKLSRRKRRFRDAPDQQGRR
jgi:hypothetical protein